MTIVQQMFARVTDALADVPGSLVHPPAAQSRRANTLSIVCAPTAINKAMVALERAGIAFSQQTNPLCLRVQTGANPNLFPSRRAKTFSEPLSRAGNRRAV